MFNRIPIESSRPENQWKDFVIETKIESINKKRQAVTTWGEIAKDVHAILCGATTQEKLRYQQINHPITHVIAHRGKPKAKEGDRLIMKSRAFYIQGVDDPGYLGIWTLYFCEERSGVQNASQL